MGKVKFGLSACEYGVLDKSEKVTQSKRLPGLTSAKLELTNELKTLSADDGPYVVVSGGITEAKLTIETYDLTSDARKDFFGITVQNGVEKYNKDNLCIYDYTLNGLENIVRLMIDIYNPKIYRKNNLNLPIYFIAGSEDPVITSIEAWNNAQEFLRKQNRQQHRLHKDLWQKPVPPPVFQIRRKLQSFCRPGQM